MTDTVLLKKLESYSEDRKGEIAELTAEAARFVRSHLSIAHGAAEIYGGNMKEKSVTDIIEEVRDEMCTHYCKWPEKWDSSQGEICDSEMCNNCPLNRL